MKLVTIKKWPFRGVHGHVPVSEDPEALDLARILGQTMAKAARQRI